MTLSPEALAAMAEELDATTNFHEESGATVCEIVDKVGNLRGKFYVKS
jgi:hypothetical protein